MQATLSLAMELRTEFANFYSAMAYPGSPLYKRALEECRQLPDTWAGYSQHNPDCTPLGNDYLTPAEIVAFRDRAFQTYFNDQSYLDFIERKFGTRTVAHIRKMVSYPLPRKLLHGLSVRQIDEVYRRPGPCQ
jgi:anaerobic magnesium-protoporphyrin IX monomethyl ester cyclase